MTRFAFDVALLSCDVPFVIEANRDRFAILGRVAAPNALVIFRERLDRGVSSGCQTIAGLASLEVQREPGMAMLVPREIWELLDQLSVAAQTRADPRAAALAIITNRERRGYGQGAQGSVC